MNTPDSAHYSIKSALIKVLATLFIINENTIFFIVLDPKNLIHGYIVSHCQYLISILLYLFRKRYEAIQHILLIISGYKRTVLTYRRLQYMVMISFQYTFFFFIVNVKIPVFLSTEISGSTNLGSACLEKWSYLIF